MKPDSSRCLHIALPAFQRFFPLWKLERWWRDCERRRYPRQIGGVAVVKALVWALALRLPSLESILRREGSRLGTKFKSSLSYAFRRASHLALLRRMVEQLTHTFSPDTQDIIALDSMPVTFSRKRRSDAKKTNKNTKGAAAIWEFVLTAPKRCTPVRLLKIVHGAWNDSFQVLDMPLVARGPLYLMDRGFYSFKAIAQWLKNDVRFIVRAKARQASFEAIKVFDEKRLISPRIYLLFDGIVWLGTKRQVKVRLIQAIVGNQELILATNLLDPPAAQILAHYRLRWHIERFHKLLKQTLGMAHLFSFQKNGIEMMLYAALLLTLLLYMQAEQSEKHYHQTIDQIRAALLQLRKLLKVESHWIRNSSLRKRKRT